jgi:putative transposase
MTDFGILGGMFSPSCRGNCHDNAVAESFLDRLNKEKIRRRTYSHRDDARRDAFEYTEMLYNPKRKHTNSPMLPPVDFEIRRQKLNEAGV